MKTKTSFKTLILLITMALGSSVMFNSCKDDPCDDQVCLNGGTCDDGRCDCPAGYEDSNCGTESRSKYLGTWSTTNETCTSGGPSIFDITISSNSGDINKINISNIYGASFTVVATLNGSNVSIPNQSFGTGSISGSGSFSGNSLTLSYTVSGGGLTDVCNNVVFNKI